MVNDDSSTVVETPWRDIQLSQGIRYNVAGRAAAVAFGDDDMIDYHTERLIALRHERRALRRVAA